MGFLTWPAALRGSPPSSASPSGGTGSAAVALFNDGTPKTFGVVVVVFAVITLAAVALAQPSKTTHPV